jgi:hypothetical protein
MSKSTRNKKAVTATPTSRPKCGLCGKSTNLTQTECCGNWICDDTDQYVLFSYARNSCYRNHDRYTLCSFHHHEGHPGRWQDCPKCRADFETEIYVYYGTNEYNFERLENPPAYQATRCARCGKVIRLGEDGYSFRAGQYFCEQCSAIEIYGDPAQKTAPRQIRHRKS